MRKKSVLAVLALCAMLGLSACGTQKTETAAPEESKQTDTQTSAASGEVLAEESAAAEGETQDTSIGRLVSVKEPSDYIKIGEYKGIELENATAAVTEEDVETSIQNTLASAAVEVPAEEKVQNGDIILMDCSGTQDGVAFETGVEENSTLVIGSGSFIDGFEDALIGLKAGETKEFPLTFPEDYWSEEMAGKEVVFTVTVNSIRRAPELTDEWVAANTTSTTIDEYKEAVKAELQQQNEENAREAMLGSAWSILVSSTEVKEYPEEDLQAAISQARAEIEALATANGMELADFLETQNMTEEDLTTLETQYAQEFVKQNLIVQEIIDKEKIDLNDEETQTIRQELVDMYGVSDLSVLISQYGKVRVDSSIALRRVEVYLVENARIIEAAEEAAVVEPTGTPAPDPTGIVGADGVDTGAAADNRSISGADEVDMSDGNGTTKEQEFEENGIAVVEDDGEAE